MRMRSGLHRAQRVVAIHEATHVAAALSPLGGRRMLGWGGGRSCTCCDAGSVVDRALGAAAGRGGDHAWRRRQQVRQICRGVASIGAGWMGLRVLMISLCRREGHGMRRVRLLTDEGRAFGLGCRRLCRAGRARDSRGAWQRPGESLWGIVVGVPMTPPRSRAQAAAQTQAQAPAHLEQQQQINKRVTAPGG